MPPIPHAIPRLNAPTSQSTRRSVLAALLATILAAVVFSAPTRLDSAEPVPFPQQYEGVSRWNHSGYFRMHHSVGQGFNFDDLFTTLGTFRAIEDSKGLWFLDGQVGISDDGFAGGNLGVGRRHYFPELERMVDLSLWYDADQGRLDWFDQLGFSVGTLGEKWDTRFEVTVPINGTGRGSVQRLGYSGTQLTHFTDELTETSFRRVEVEVGRNLFDWTGIPELRLHGGLYYLDGGGDSTVGWMSRLQGNVNDSLSLQMTTRDDALFGTQVAVGMTWTFPGGRAHRGREPMSAWQRRFQGVNRSGGVVTRTDSQSEQETVLAPGGSPLSIVHVDSSATAGGDGSFESPFDSLAAAAAASPVGALMLAHAGSVFTGESVTLQDQQRLLGDGIDHVVSTDSMGMIVLPRANASSSLPQIRDSLGDAITMADSSELSGFDIFNSAGVGIRGSGVDNLLISRNRVFGSGGHGVFLDSVGGTNVLTNLSIYDSVATGLRIDNATGSLFALNPQIIEPAEHGIHLTNSSLNAIFTNTIVDGSGVFGGTYGNGIFLEENATSDLRFDEVSIRTDNGGGIVAVNSGTVTATGTEIEANGGPAIDIDPTEVYLTFNRLISRNSPTFGIRLEDVTGTVSVLDDVIIENPASAGVLIRNSDVAVTFNELSIMDATGSAVWLDQAAGNFSVNGTARIDGATPIGFQIEQSTADVYVRWAEFQHSIGREVSLLTNTGSIVINRFESDFQIFDGTSFSGAPDLSAYGIQAVDIAYVNEFFAGSWPNIDLDTLSEPKIRQLANQAADAGQILIIDIEHWGLDNRTVSEAEVDESLDKYAQIVTWLRDERPELEVGLYGVPPIRDYWVPALYLEALENQHIPYWASQLATLDANYQSWQAANDRLTGLADQMDYLFPSLYTFYDDRDDWRRYAVGNISEARRYGKPVYPFLWMNFHGSHPTTPGAFIPGDFWRQQLETVGQYADGAVIWGGLDLQNPDKYPWDDNAPWWQETLDFIDQMNP